MLFAIPALVSVLGSAAATTATVAVSAKTAAAAGAVVGAAVAASSASRRRKDAETSSRRELEQALEEAYAKGRADGQWETVEEYRRLAYSEGRRKGSQRERKRWCEDEEEVME